MTQWIIQTYVDYEGISEDYCSSAQEVIDLLNRSYKSWYEVTIIPQPQSRYEQHEFREAFAKGLVT